MSRQMPIESMIDLLLGSLDQEAEHLGRVTEYLASLSRLIVKRDEAGLNELLGQVHREAQAHEANERLRVEMTNSLARLLGCQATEVTLSKLEKSVGGQTSLLLQKKRIQLRKLVDELRKQHYSTMMLLVEMIRINRSLLAGITGGSDSITYGRGGQARWAGADNILNLRY